VPRRPPAPNATPGAASAGAADDGTAVELFIEMMTAERGAAGNTQEAYRRDLAHAAAFLRRRGCGLSAAAAADLRAYLAALSRPAWQLLPLAPLSRPVDALAQDGETGTLYGLSAGALVESEIEIQARFSGFHVGLGAIGRESEVEVHRARIVTTAAQAAGRDRRRRIAVRAGNIEQYVLVLGHRAFGLRKQLPPG